VSTSIALGQASGLIDWAGRFAELYGGNTATDRVRQQQLPRQGPTLDYLDEAFTSENWIVRALVSYYVIRLTCVLKLARSESTK
jgi:hypothetical protein